MYLRGVMDFSALDDYREVYVQRCPESKSSCNEGNASDAKRCEQISLAAN